MFVADVKEVVATELVTAGVRYTLLWGKWNYRYDTQLHLNR